MNRSQSVFFILFPRSNSHSWLGYPCVTKSTPAGSVLIQFHDNSAVHSVLWLSRISKKLKIVSTISTYVLSRTCQCLSVVAFLIVVLEKIRKRAGIMV